jgi:hypothetical protein
MSCFLDKYSFGVMVSTAVSGVAGHSSNGYSTLYANIYGDVNLLERVFCRSEWRYKPISDTSVLFSADGHVLQDVIVRHNRRVNNSFGGFGPYRTEMEYIDAQRLRFNR